MKLIVFLDHYLPGYRAGGPPRTLANMVERLGDKIDFWIFTRNHDFANPTPYPNVRTNSWNPVGRAHVYYCSPDARSMRTIRRVIVDTCPDAIYLNSFFSSLTAKCLLLRRLGMLPRIPCIVAPRGEFSPNALKLKGLKKLIYRAIAKLLGLYSNVVWQASSSLESNEIRRVMGARCSVHTAANIPTKLVVVGEKRRDVRKVPGQVRFVFVSRISPKKNLGYALQLLESLHGDVIFDIFGPTESAAYSELCSKIMRSLPANVKATYNGALAPAEVVRVLSNYHFFLFPTLGENFGHAIFEALNAGCPIVISDQTPWRDLAAKRAGWDLPLEDSAAWTEVLQRCVAMDEPTFAAHSHAARALAESISSDRETEERNLALFRGVLAAA